MPFKEKWGVGYGGVLQEDLVRKFMDIGEGKILVQSPIEMGLKGDNVYADADRFFDHLKLSKEIRIPKYVEFMREENEPEV